LCSAQRYLVAGPYLEYAIEGNASGLDAIIANDTAPPTIDIAGSDYVFKSSGGCNWLRIG
jgi:hypothetical protein